MSLRSAGSQLLETAPSPLLAGASTASMSIWVRVNPGSSVVDPAGVQLFGDLGGKLAVGLEVSGRLRVDWSSNDGSANHASGWRQRLAAVPGATYHLAATWQNGIQRYYVNGLLVGSDNQPGTLGMLGDQAPHPFRLGSDLAGVDITLDEPTLWVGYTLTPADVLALRDRSSAPGAIAPSSIALRWTLTGPDGGQATPGSAGVVDASPTHLDLTSVVGSAPSYQAGDLTYSLLDNGCSAVVGPSGESVIFSFHDEATDPVNVTIVTSNNEQQSIVITGRPTGDSITLGFQGHSTAPIPTIPSPPAAFFQWNKPDLGPGTFDLQVNIFGPGGTQSATVNYEVFDGSTSLGSFTLNHATNSGNPTPVLDPVLTQRSFGSGNGVPISRYPIGRYTFATGNLQVRVSCPATPSDHNGFDADCLWIVPVGGAPETRLLPTFPPCTYATGLLPYANDPQGYQPLGDSANMFLTTGTGVGLRYLLDPSVVQSSLEALPNVGVGNVSVTGDGSSIRPTIVTFQHALGDSAQPLLTCSPIDGTIAIAHSAVGGILPAIRINGGSPIQLTRSMLYYNSLQPTMPTAQFFFPQHLPDAPFKYAVAFQYDNALVGNWQSAFDGNAGDPAHAKFGYTNQVRHAAGIGPTATYCYRPTAPGQYRVSFTWPVDPQCSTDVVYTVDEMPGSVLPAVADNGAAQHFVAGIATLGGPRTITATAGGNASNIGAVSVTINGLDASGSSITETLPAFTAGSAGTVAGSLLFSTVTSITIPAHAGAGVTTSIGARVGSYQTNQTIAPSGPVDGGVPWEIGPTLTLGRSATAGLFNGLIVTQTNSTGLVMMADTVRFERLSADDSIAIQPGDVVTYSAGPGWLSSLAGPAPAATDLPVDNRSGGTIYTPSNAPTTMKIGWNLPILLSLAPTYYSNLAHTSDGLDAYPTVIGNYQASVNIANSPTAFGADRKNAPNVLSGDYVLMWDGASNAGLGNGIAGGNVEHLDQAVYTGLPGSVDNKRVYTLNAGDFNYGTEISLTIHGTTPTGVGPDYNVDFRNLRVFPAGVDPATAPKYHPVFSSNIHGVKTIRHLDGLAAIEGNCSDFADYMKPQDHVSRNIQLNTTVIDLSGVIIQQYTGTEYTFDTRFGSVFEFIFPQPHGLKLGQLFLLDNYTGDLATLSNGTSTTQFQVASHSLFTYPLADPTRLVTHGGVNGYTAMTNVITNAGGQLVMRSGTGIPLQDLVEINNAAGADFYFNTHFANTDVCLTAIGAYMAANLAPGLKLRVECANEVWNFSGTVFAWAVNGTKVFYGGSGDDPIHYYCETAHRHHSLIKAAWVAGGRDPADFRAIMGSQMYSLGFTGSIASYFHSKGWTFDELVVANYMDNAPGMTTNYQREWPFYAICDGMSVGQHLDMWEVHRKFGRYEEEVPSHKATLIEDGRTEFQSVDIGFYEGGPDILLLECRTDDHPGPYNLMNNGFKNHGMQRHPRFYGILVDNFRLAQDSGAAFANVFQFQGSDTSNIEAWGAYRAAGQLPYVPGNPVQDAIQINQVDRVDLHQSVTGGAVKHFSSLYGAPVTPPSPPTTGRLSGPTSGTSGVASAPFTVTLDVAAPVGGQPVTLADSSGGNGFAGNHVAGAVLTIPAGSIADTFTYTRASAGSSSLSIAAPGLTISGSPIAFVATTTTPTPTTATLAQTPTTYVLGVETEAIVVTLNAPAPPGGTVVGLRSSVAGDVFHATIGGGPVTSITVAPGSTRGHFYLVAVTDGTHNVSIASTGLAIVGSPLSLRKKRKPRLTWRCW